MTDADFYEDDEPLERVRAIADRFTSPPVVTTATAGGPVTRWVTQDGTGHFETNAPIVDVPRYNGVPMRLVVTPRLRPAT